MPWPSTLLTPVGVRSRELRHGRFLRGEPLEHTAIVRVAAVVLFVGVVALFAELHDQRRVCKAGLLRGRELTHLALAQKPVVFF